MSDGIHFFCIYVCLYDFNEVVRFHIFSNNFMSLKLPICTSILKYICVTQENIRLKKCTTYFTVYSTRIMLQMTTWQLKIIIKPQPTTFRLIFFFFIAFVRPINQNPNTHYLKPPKRIIYWYHNCKEWHTNGTSPLKDDIKSYN